MPKNLFSFLSISTATALGVAAQTNVHAQENEKNVMVVFDASGSMWGQINGRTKIEIARETLSQVLSETTQNMNLGMIAYGHRKKGQCSDIETVVRAGPSRSTVPAMINAANAIKPKGKTPLSDAVRIAAQELRYTENEATVVLVTDGIETCDADPCALATELENSGIDFTTHVVGFGLSREEGRQVSCLAENTGGKYFSADDANGLGDALEETFAALPDEDDFEDAVTIRNVRFIFRDTSDGPQIGIRQLSGTVQKKDGTPVGEEDFKFVYPEANGASAFANLEPGNYIGLFERNGGYSIRYQFDVPEGTGEYIIEANLSGALQINAFINPNLAYKKGNPFPTAIGGSRTRMSFHIHAIEKGNIVEEPVAKTTISNTLLPLSPGKYIIRGNLDSTVAAERIIEVSAGRTTQIDFSFDATRVFIDARNAEGQPVKRQTTYWYDKVPSGRNYWRSGGGVIKGNLVPFYLPTGTWITNVGGEGKGKRRSEIVVRVPGDYQDMRLTVGESQKLSDQNKAFFNSISYQGCLEILKVGYSGCLVKKAALQPYGTQANSAFEESNKQSTQSAQVPSIPLPFKQEFAAFSGIFASIGFEINVKQTGMTPHCTSKPILLTENGILVFNRLENNEYVAEETRYCSKHSSGEIDCHIVPVSEDGKRADVVNIDKSAPMVSLRNYDPVTGTAESCLAGPTGRDGPRLCTNIQVCTNAAFKDLNRSVVSTIFDAPRSQEN